MMKFDTAKKVALIKEVKALLEGMNLVQVCKRHATRGIIVLLFYMFEFVIIVSC